MSTTELGDQNSCNSTTSQKSIETASPHSEKSPEQLSNRIRNLFARLAREESEAARSKKSDDSQNSKVCYFDDCGQTQNRAEVLSWRSQQIPTRWVNTPYPSVYQTECAPEESTNDNATVSTVNTDSVENSLDNFGPYGIQIEYDNQTSESQLRCSCSHSSNNLYCQELFVENANSNNRNMGYNPDLDEKSNDTNFVPVFTKFPNNLIDSTCPDASGSISQTVQHGSNSPYNILHGLSSTSDNIPYCSNSTCYDDPHSFNVGNSSSSTMQNFPHIWKTTNHNIHKASLEQIPQGSNSTFYNEHYYSDSTLDNDRHTSISAFDNVSNCSISAFDVSNCSNSTFTTPYSSNDSYFHIWDTSPTLTVDHSHSLVCWEIVGQEENYLNDAGSQANQTVYPNQTVHGSEDLNQIVHDRRHLNQSVNGSQSVHRLSVPTLPHGMVLKIYPNPCPSCGITENIDPQVEYDGQSVSLYGGALRFKLSG